MATRISVFTSPELLAVLQAMQSAEKTMAKYIRQETKKMAEPEWKRAVAERVSTRQEAKVLANTARAAVSNQNVTLRSGAIGRSLSGGAKPSELVHHVEFGADQNFTRSYDSVSRKGKHFTVHNRHTRRQFRPRKLKGYAVYPAASEIIPRLAALWVQTVARTLHDAAEGKES